jgi:hypothetical protein
MNPVEIVLDSLIDLPESLSPRFAIPDRLDPWTDETRYGHGGIAFEGVVSENGTPYEDCYRAFWPGIGEDWSVPAPGRIVTDYSYDVRLEGSRPSRSIELHPGLNEALVYRYWNSLQAMPMDYSAQGFNCCSAVATSIQDGFPVAPRIRPPDYSPLNFVALGFMAIDFSNPYYLEEWTLEVNSWLRRL